MNITGLTRESLNTQKISANVIFCPFAGKIFLGKSVLLIFVFFLGQQWNDTPTYLNEILHTVYIH